MESEYAEYRKMLEKKNGPNGSMASAALAENSELKALAKYAEKNVTLGTTDRAEIKAKQVKN